MFSVRSPSAYTQSEDKSQATVMVPPPSTSEIFSLATKHNTLARALLLHPSAGHEGDHIVPSKTPPTLYNTIDFEMTTYTQYLIPLLPPKATKNCRVLANPWSYNDPDFKEDLDKPKPECYPSLRDNGELLGKYTDAISRGMMIAMVILDRSKHVMFGGPFEFGEEVEEAARGLVGE